MARPLFMVLSLASLLRGSSSPQRVVHDPESKSNGEDLHEASLASCNSLLSKSMGLNHAQVDSWIKAETCYRKILTTDPSSALSRHRLGWLLHRRGMRLEAEGNYKMGLVFDPINPGIHESLAQLLLDRGAWSEAEWSYRSVLHSVPTRAMSWYSLAMVIEDRFPEAIDSLNTAIRLDPNRPEYWADLGRIQRKSLPHPWSEAESSLRWAIHLSNASTEAYYDLADVLHHRGKNHDHDAEQAEQALRTGLEIDPTNGRFWEALVIVKMNHGYPTADLDLILKSMVEANISRAFALARLAQLSMMTGNNTDAIELFKDSLKINPDQSRQRTRLGAALMSNGRSDEALAQWQFVLNELAGDGKSPAWFIRPHACEKDEFTYRHNLHEELVSFRMASNATFPHSDFPSKLSEALSEIRKRENNTAWILNVSTEFAMKLGLSVEEAYSSMTFAAWLNATNRPVVQQAIQKPQSLALIMGSATGYQCLFAIAVGFSRCVGYDVLCDSMVAPARNTIREHGLHSRISYHCQDALTSDLFSEAAMIWTNVVAGYHSAFQKFDEALWSKVFHEMRPDGLLVTWRRPRPLPGSIVALKVVDEIHVRNSWGYVELFLLGVDSERLGRA